MLYIGIVIIEIIINPKELIRNGIIFLSYVFFSLMYVYGRIIGFDSTVLLIIISGGLIIIEAFYFLIKK